MDRKPVAEALAEIAERERSLAVEEGDYVWAFLCAVVEQQARELVRGRSP